MSDTDARERYRIKCEGCGSVLWTLENRDAQVAAQDHLRRCDPVVKINGERYQDTASSQNASTESAHDE